MSYPPPPPDGDSPEPDPQGQGAPGPPQGRPDHGQGYGPPGHGPHGHGPQPPYGYDPSQPPYGRPPGQQPPGHGDQAYGYGAGWPYPPGYHPGRPEHPGAVPSLVIGVIALVGGLTCVLAPLTVLGPWAWVKGKRTVDEIDASGGQLGGRGIAFGGYVCGIIATGLLVLIVLLLILAVVLGVIAGTTATGA